MCRQSRLGKVTGFSLTMPADATPVLSALALSFGRGSTMLAGIEVLVDLGTTTTQLVASGLSVPFALPIPPLPWLHGIALTAQSLPLEANGTLAASRGLTLTVL